MQTIYYGAPGTGKSYMVDELVKASGVGDDRIFRTTFHPEYTYNDFVGQLLPKVQRTTSGSTSISYEFTKGVFTRALEKAYEDTAKQVFLIIEEMSRGDCAGIFGDIFQLLDRESQGINKGYSKYFINNDIIAKDIIAITDDKIKLPPNFNILGTVNTSDQNVFVMDTAFKRRFEWQYISTKPVPVGGPYKNNIDTEVVLDNAGIKKTVKWVDLYGTLNKFIADSRFLGLGEDKQLGQFFIEFKVGGTPSEHKNQVKNKLLHYLWSDIHKSSYSTKISLFDSSITSFSELYDAYEDDKKVFSDKFLECIELWLRGSL